MPPAPRRNLEARSGPAAGPRAEPPDRGSGTRPDQIARRRRQRHLQQLRRDFATDVLAAVALTVFVIAITAGLGVVALLEVLGASVLVASFVIERRARGVTKLRREGKHDQRRR